MSLVAVFFLSCSNSENNANQKTAKQLAYEKQVKELVHNPEFRNAITNLYHSPTMRDGNPNRGAFTINNTELFLYGFTLPNDRILICASLDTYGTITILPNGSARFTTRSNEPYAAIIDINTFQYVFSNDADVDKLGSMFINYVSKYELINYGFGDIYYPTEPQSAGVLRLETSVSDSQPIYDDQYNVIGYTPETVRKNLRVRNIEAPNSSGNINFDIRLN